MVWVGTVLRLLDVLGLLVLILREAMMDWLMGCLFRGRGGCGWSNITLWGGIEGGSVCIGNRVGI